MRQLSLFWHAQCHLGLYCATPSGGFRLPIPCVLQFAGEDVGTCSRHNLHRTGYTENNRQGTVGSQRGGPSFLTLIIFVLDLSTCVHRADILIDLPTEVSRLYALCVCRFLIFERQQDSDWGFLLLRYLLSGTWILRHFLNQWIGGW